MELQKERLTMNEMGSVDSIDSIDSIDKISETTKTSKISEIEEINQSNKNNELKNSFPIVLNKISRANKKDKTDKTDTDIMRTERPGKLHVTNIGQLIFVLFLLIVIFTQTINLFPISMSNKTSQETNSPLSNARNNAENIESENNSENYLNFFEKSINKIEHGDDIYNVPGEENLSIIFILGESEGKLAILSPDGTSVYEMYDVYINTLPEYDRNLLLDGIKITSSEELHSLLEDYSS